MSPLLFPDRSIQSEGSYTVGQPPNRPGPIQMRSPVRDTRDRLVQVSAALLQRQGLTGNGDQADPGRGPGAPYSSLYHHFPGGKDELAAAAIRVSGAQYQELVEGGLGRRP